MVTNNNIDKVIKIIKKQVKRYEDPATENIAGDYRTPFFILVTTLLSARTKDKVTETVSRKLFKKIKNAKDLIRLKQAHLARLIYPIGFYRTKARHLKELARVLAQRYNNKVPDEMEKLLTLPGVGRKTANLVLIIAFNKYGICVDTHVHRIVNRWGYIRSKTPQASEMYLRQKLPKKYWKTINHLLVSYGKTICRPVNPLCQRCQVKCYCSYGMKEKNKEGIKR
ncbi:MAG: endonuclease III [Spirochaetes bacterium]|nr:endonuclease III [Spirochaetota bacterium]